jgi:electron transport complex protein RnfG
LDGTLAGVRALNHKETPGLGDKIDLRKSPWIHSFDNLSLNNPSPEHWLVKKDGGHFDQFTGATITPRAVVKRVKQTLELFEQQKNNWLKDLPIVPELKASEKSDAAAIEVTP